MSHTTNPTLEKIVALAKRRGFVFPTSEIYGGLANSYDYGPVGSSLLKNIRDSWWHTFVNKRHDMVGLDSTIMLRPETWVASGHVASFSDPLVEDIKSHKRYRADHLIEAWIEKNPSTVDDSFNVEDLTVEAMGAFITTNKITSPEGNPVTEPKAFNLLFETAIGSVSGDKSTIYLRGETAQGIFSDFKNVLDSTRVKLPFGVGQMGKSFRNEITTGQFVFRTLEFEQAEIEYFFNPNTENGGSDWQTLFNDWKEAMWEFVTADLGVQTENLRWRKHTDTERSHYSLDTYDLEYQYPFGFKELWGIAYRTDYDLKQHQEHANQKLQYTDPHTGETFVPHVIEPALGLNRAFLMVLCDAYREDTENNRIVLELKPDIAPYHVAVFPLLKNKPELVAKAEAVRDQLTNSRSKWRVAYDDRGNIGKRYLSQDEIGTPFCITIDFDTLENNEVTIRNRTTTQQEKVSVDQIEKYLVEHCS
jgi:glycyl-tRNA synthetase